MMMMVTHAGYVGSQHGIANFSALQQRDVNCVNIGTDVIA